MKKITRLTILFVCFLTIPLVAASAQDKMDHSSHVGDKIHESKVQGFQLAYHLLKLPNRKPLHLMVYLFDPDGKAVTRATVGYLVAGPDGSKQKVMAMAMKDAFGGDVDFSNPGTYTIKAKAVVGEVKLLDQFEYDVK